MRTDRVGGIIALRDGLDAANFTRFPAAQFGPWGHNPQQHVARLQAIAAAFAHRGAGEHTACRRSSKLGCVAHTDDAALLQWSATRKRRRRARCRAAGATAPTMSGTAPGRVSDRSHPRFIFRCALLPSPDPGGIVSGNYGNGLVTQLQPFETSVGWWGVGPKDQPYGRYARGFERATGRTDISFVLDTRLWGGLPLSAADERTLTLAVTYLDGMAGFAIFFDTASGCATPKRTISGAGSGRWITTTFVISDGHFGRRCESKGGAADIVLRSTTPNADAIIHGLEIYDPAHAPSLASDAPAACSSTFGGYDLMGGDLLPLGRGFRNASSPSDCCRMCSETPGCAFFSATKAGETAQAAGYPPHNCWLKASAGKPRATHDRVCGAAGALPLPPPPGHDTEPDACFPKPTAPWCDTTKPFATRVSALVSALTLPEKVAQISTYTPSTVPGVPRLGLPPFSYHSEGLHGLRNSFDTLGFNATLFPQVTAMAATGNMVRPHQHLSSFPRLLLP